MNMFEEQPISASQIKAEIETITFHAQDSGWTVLKARNCESNLSFTATGNFASISPGESFEFFGQWSNHASFGRQFKIERAVAMRPTSRAAIERYLASKIFKGIGPKTAKKITEHFGHETLTILDTDPERLNDIPTLGRKLVNQIIESWQEQRSAADVMMFLAEHNITQNFAHRIIKLYGKDAISVITVDPYCLVHDIPGIGFISADKIAQSIGIAPDSPQRIKAAVLYTIQQSEDNGHCYLLRSQLSGQLEDILKISSEQLDGHFQDCLNSLIAENLIACESILTEKNSEDSEPVTAIACYRSDLFLAEVGASQAIHELQETASSSHELESKSFKTRVEKWLTKYSEQNGTILSKKQIESVQLAAQSKVFILTGGPGVGKTTTANTIIQLFKAMNKTVSLAAPTGRAARRLSEVSSTEAKTIHRLLEWNPSEANFNKNEQNTLTSDVVIVDEASMLDIILAEALFKAVRKSAQLILIGDVDQLPSVGPGNVLHDLIDSGVVTSVRLDEIFRQAAKSKIIQSSHSINQGILPDFSNEDGSDCRFIEVAESTNLKETIKDLVINKLPAAGYDSFKDIQILTPMNRGNLGTVQINEELQDAQNPKTSDLGEYRRKNYTLRNGDKVIQCINNYDLAVFNGDIGYVEHTNVDDAKVIVKYPNKIVKYDAEQATELKLAYAITVHKAQGSEFPVVIIPTSMQHYIMLQRNLFYTALTRARKLAIFIGAKKSLEIACSNQLSSKRQTRLKERLQNSNN
jgi:exodeoxyribonuclease V alpha subunit